MAAAGTLHKFGNILIEKVFLPTKAEKYSLSACVRNFEREKKILENTKESSGSSDVESV